MYPIPWWDGNHIGSGILWDSAGVMTSHGDAMGDITNNVKCHKERGIYTPRSPKRWVFKGNMMNNNWLLRYHILRRPYFGVRALGFLIVFFPRPIQGLWRGLDCLWSYAIHISRVNEFGKKKHNFESRCFFLGALWAPRSISCWFSSSTEAPTDGGKPPDLSTWQFFFSRSIRDRHGSRPDGGP